MTKSYLHTKARKGFSLIELVIVVVIIAIIGAIAVPRMSRGAQGASDSSLHANLKILRSAIDLYATEHAGKFPTDESYLTGYTDEGGTSVKAAKDTSTGHIYGPYLRAVPTLPVGANKGKSAFETTTLGAAGKGWFYNATTGELKANCANTEKDGSDVAYNTY